MTQDLATLLREVRERCAKATPGPWEYPPWTDTLDRWAVCQTRDGRDGSTEFLPGLAAVARQRDADFIAHARTDIPALLEAITRLREQRVVSEGKERALRELCERRLQDQDPVVNKLVRELLAILDRTDTTTSPSEAEK